MMALLHESWRVADMEKFVMEEAVETKVETQGLLEHINLGTIMIKDLFNSCQAQYPLEANEAIGYGEL